MSDKNLKSSRTKCEKRVLVVNGNPNLSEALVFLRRQRQNFHFFQEHVATADALEAMEPNVFDLVIVDTSVDGKNGKNVAYQIKARYPMRPIIMLCIIEDEKNNKPEIKEPVGENNPTTRNTAVEMLQALDYADSLLRCKISGFTISLNC